tara:strand:- start:413 stop:538 length:126 start_codon:yes stop_codon:yes gene_type:complete
MGNDLPLNHVPLVDLADLSGFPALLHRDFIDIVDTLIGRNS